MLELTLLLLTTLRERPLYRRVVVILLLTIVLVLVWRVPLPGWPTLPELPALS
jgi:hypothetical protein